MTEEEIVEELAIVNAAIRSILKLGKKYEIGTGPSKRVFEAEDLDKLRSLRTELKIELSQAQGTSGIVVGY